MMRLKVIFSACNYAAIKTLQKVNYYIFKKLNKCCSSSARCQNFENFSEFASFECAFLFEHKVISYSIDNASFSQRTVSQGLLWKVFCMNLSP